MKGMSHAAIRDLIAGATVAVMVLSGCVSAPKYVIENGRIVVDSPFDLEIGSTEYAKALGSKVHTSVHANYDPKTLLGLDKTLYFAGKVGDLAVDISYAPPRYAKKDGRFEIVCRGAVVVNVVQSPVVTTGWTKNTKGSSSH